MRNLISFAIQYTQEQRLRSRTLLHNCTRFVNIAEVERIDQIDSAAIAIFRDRAKQTLSIWTIEKTITDVITVLRYAGQTEVTPGKRLRRPRPMPSPVSVDAIGRTWQSADGWLRQWIVLSYWTGLRLADSIRLQLQLTGTESDRLQLVASKTGHAEVWPLPDWLRPHLQPLSLPYGHANDHAMLLIRSAITRANREHPTDWLPKNLRQRSITEWSQANGMAGAIIHGSGLRVLTHYVDPISILSSASERLRLPNGWRSDHNRDQSQLLETYRRLDPSAQQLISETARRLATG